MRVYVYNWIKTIEDRYNYQQITTYTTKRLITEVQLVYVLYDEIEDAMYQTEYDSFVLRYRRIS